LFATISAHSRPRIAATRPNGSINRSIEHQRVSSGARHGNTSALSVDAAAVQQVRSSKPSAIAAESKTPSGTAASLKPRA
jgi:hypothetical protein